MGTKVTEPVFAKKKSGCSDFSDNVALILATMSLKSWFFEIFGKTTLRICIKLHTQVGYDVIQPTQKLAGQEKFPFHVISHINGR